MRHYGLVLEERDPRAWNFGSSAAVLDVLQPNGQWDKFLPDEELQNLGYFEPAACASFGTLNCVETLLRRRYSQVENYSDRWLAKATGTDKKGGNEPHYVAEYLRVYGDVYEKDYPMENVFTFEEYYKPLPDLKDVFLPQFEFQHEYVDSNPEAMKAALKLSPLGVSVCGWFMDEDGLFYKPADGKDNHWTMCYGYEDGKYWKVFDSYSNTTKKVKWDNKFQCVKRYHIKRTAASQQQLSLLAQILRRIQLFLASL